MKKQMKCKSSKFFSVDINYLNKNAFFFHKLNVTINWNDNKPSYPERDISSDA